MRLLLRRQARAMRHFGSGLIGVLFIAAGTLHFRYTDTYERIIPPAFPAHRELVLISGACEMLGGIGMLIPSRRRYAAFGLIALLAAVFPANIFMALDARRFAPLPAWSLWGRLPLQFVLMWCVYAAGAKRAH